MHEYLSADWVAAVDAAMSADADLVDMCADAELTLQQIVTDAPSGRIELVFRFGAGVASAKLEADADPDITFTQSYATAVGVYAGTLNALDAFQNGRIELSGDSLVLDGHRSLLVRLERAFGVVRSATTRR